MMSRTLTLVLGLLMFGTLVKAQTGIGTGDPKATLHVVGEPTENLVMDGIIAPRITGDQLHAKTYTMEQKGAILLVTEVPAVANQVGQTEKVKKAGYYFFDGEKWQGFSSGSNVWNKAKTNTAADSNTDDMYVMGKVGVGTNDPTTTLDVNGDLKIQKIEEAKDDDTQVLVGADGVLRKSIYPNYKMNTITGRFKNGVLINYLSDEKTVGEIKFRVRGQSDQIKVEMQFTDSSMPSQTAHIRGTRAVADMWTQLSTANSFEFSHMFQFNFEADFGGYANLIFEHGMCYRVDFHAWRYGPTAEWVYYNVTITELSDRQW